ncbi:MAG: hypothetical protein NUK65_02010 [Firmicutes bacterium]|nr:hypothetical protein [Bacillota bacterium]
MFGRIGFLEMFMSLIFFIGIPVCLFFIVKYFIRYNAQQKRKKTQQQEELDKMNIEDL